MPQILIGTSGFSYPHWRHGVFYPERWPAARELEYYAERFPTVELNNPFYRLPRAETFAAWSRRVPEGFVFAVKASRYITHIRRLHAAGPALRLFLRRAEKLGGKLGPILFQFPSAWRINLERLESFLPLLPPRRQFAFEFRHESWFVPPVFELLRAHGAAWCQAIRPDLPPPPKVITAPFTYLRFHSGTGEGGNFTEAELRAWARAVRAQSRGAAVYAYFNNDWQAFALANARRLTQLSRAAAGAPGGRKLARSSERGLASKERRKRA